MGLMRVSRMDIKGEMIIEKIFEAYLKRPERLTDYVFGSITISKQHLLPRRGLQNLDRSNVAKRKVELRDDKVFIRLVAAHIAGMTDTFAIQNIMISLYPPQLNLLINTKESVSMLNKGKSGNSRRSLDRQSLCDNSRPPGAAL